MKILVVDDEKEIVQLIRITLKEEGYHILGVFNGEEALKIASEKIPDLIILDLILPGIDGLEVCRILKNNTETKDIPIIMLTAKGSETDVVVGLELGADDYMHKPFRPRELIARVKAVLRRADLKPKEREVIKVDDLVINSNRHEVKLNEEPIDLTPREFDLLKFMALNKGNAITRLSLLEKVWGYDFYGSTRTIDVTVGRLKKKLGSYAQRITQVRGVGYKFEEK